MIRPIYIQGIGTITIQPEEKNGVLHGVASYDTVTIPAVSPDYKALIPALQLRRMNKSMRMALYASKTAMQEAGITHIDAVITGTGLGCLTDSERFVQAMIENEEEFLNPTSFIQSTHNMAAATIALALDCKGYNMTYVHNATSMEAATLDSMLYLAEHPTATVLLGGVDELGLRTPQLWEHAGYLDIKQPRIPTILDLPGTPGEVAGEGAAFCAVSQNLNPNSLATIRAIRTQHEVADAQVWVNRFLTDHQLGIDNIDAIVLGYNGDNRYDPIYTALSEAMFPNKSRLAYKHLLGEYDAVVASGMALVARILANQHIPPALKLNQVEPLRLKRILLYNQRRGKNHSLVLMEAA